jgi:alkylation response protein AidB-like acyl-CoA dehydrogenase
LGRANISRDGLYSAELSGLKNMTTSTRFVSFDRPERARFLNIVQLILNLELARCGCRGYIDGFLAGGVIGLPPVLNFGSDEIKAQVVPEVLAGKKFICLAISEAFAGSDVSGLQTIAVRDGDYWVISGTKKYASSRDLAYPWLRD